MKSLIIKRTESLADFIFPPRCPVCDGISVRGICPECQNKLYMIGDVYCSKCGKPISDSDKELCQDCEKRMHIFSQNRGVYSYKGDIRWSLYRFKYANKREYGKEYGKIMAEQLAGWINFCGVSVIIPIPLHKERERYRGYNQAEIIANELGKNLGVPVNNKLLFRIKKTIPQKSAGKHARMTNMSGAFAALDIDLNGERILLVDDIYTTGNTMDQAALELYRHGADRIYGAVLAIGG